MPQLHATRHYAELTAQQFPHLQPESVVRTCTAFMRLLFGVVRTNHEVRLSTRGPGQKSFSLKIYRPVASFSRANRRALRGKSRRVHERRVRKLRRIVRAEYKMGPAPDMFQINPS